MTKMHTIKITHGNSRAFGILWKVFECLVSLHMGLVWPRGH
jgi:hypothetical protein